MKIALVDIETTGLIPSQHEIIELGLIVFDSRTFQILEEWTTKIKPVYPENNDPKADKVNGYNDEEWKDAPDIIPVLQDFAEKTKGCTFMAYNVSFDLGFLRYQLEKYGIETQWDYHRICLMSMAFGKVPHDKVFGWSLRTICTYLGIVPEPKLHRGNAGVRKAYEVYIKLMEAAELREVQLI